MDYDAQTASGGDACAPADAEFDKNQEDRAAAVDRAQGDENSNLWRLKQIDCDDLISIASEQFINDGFDEEAYEESEDFKKLCRTVAAARLIELEKTIPLPEDCDPAEKRRVLESAAMMAAGIDPYDEIEVGLANQMAATHHTAMQKLKESNNPDLSPAERDMCLVHCERLMAIYLRQVETLDRHRERRTKGRRG